MAYIFYHYYVMILLQYKIEQYLVKKFVYDKIIKLDSNSMFAEPMSS